MKRNYIKYDWKLIQKEYDNGLSCNDLINKFKMNKNTLVYAKRRGDFKTRSISEALTLRLSKNPRKHSEKTKSKISKSRIKFLKNNPDKVPYKLNHSSKMSYPEKKFRDALIQNGITGWTYNYQNNIYSYDFAFTELKIDVEIDGSTHLSEKVKLIDERRDQFSIEDGWKVIRFTAIEVKNDVNKCIEKLNKLLNKKPL